MPTPSRQSKRPSAPIATKTHTKITTRTKVAVIGVGLLALGLAGYGFGFIPGINTDFLYNEPPAISLADQCRDICRQNDERCLALPDADESKCKLASAQCFNTCDSDPQSVIDAHTPRAAVDPPATTAASCSLVAENIPGFRQGATLTPGDEWHPLAEYKLIASDDNVAVRAMGVKTSYDAASFDDVAVFHEGIMLGRGVLPATPGPETTITLPREFILPQDRDVRVQLMGRLANIQASSVVGGARSGVARSGALVDLGIAQGAYGADWDERYLDHSRIAAKCVSSGEHVFTNSVRGGQSFVVRKAIPTMTQRALSTTTLAGGQALDLYSFELGSASTEPVGIKKITWRYTHVHGSTRESFSNFGLRRGSLPVASEDYQIIDHTGRNLRELGLSTSTSEGLIILIFNHEEIVSGPGRAYTLQADVNNPMIGDMLRLDPSLEGPITNDTGYLTANGPGGGPEGAPGPHLDLSEPADQRAEMTNRFLWSDLSEIPHYGTFDPTALPPSSRDWIGNVIEYNLRPQTLSR